MRRVMLFAFVLLLALAASAQQKPGEPPLWTDFDMQDIPEPKEAPSGYVYDFLHGTLFEQVRQGLDFPRHYRNAADREKEAYNVNSVGEVPDSSWFTNRNGQRRMSAGEIERGPGGTGPAPGRLLVTRGKSQGVTPGFWVKDERGDTYILKFDPPEYPELVTAAEVVSTRLFYAIGYNVPENHIFRFRAEDVSISDDAKFRDDRGKERKLERADLEKMLARVARGTDGSYRAVASKMLPGKPKGGFHFYGVRRDDPNDIIPHEDRRDLRGLRIFSAWLNHNDIRAGNTLDMYVEEEDRRFLRHYLVDFGSTLGSGSTGLNENWAGHEHRFDLKEAMKVLFTLGIYQPRSERHQAPVVHRSVGNFSAEGFEPLLWKSEFPLPAFENMTARDARWAARIVGSFTDDQIRAAVAAGELSDPAAAEHLARVIAARRDKIVDTLLRDVRLARDDE